MLIRYPKILIIILLVLSSFNQEITAQDFFFNNITVENDLSNNKVNCILEDSFGFIWLGTEDGLNRFDGYEIKIYRHKPDEKNTISSNDIWSLFEDKNGFIWIGTKAGEINKYDPRLDKFESWKVGLTENVENSITSIFKDSQNNLWIGTYRNGLYLFDTDKNTFTNWNYHPEKANSISNNYITSISEDDKGTLWISTYNGLNKLNKSQSEKSFTRYYHNPKELSTLSNNLIWRIIRSKKDKNKFWLGTANGLDFYNSDNPTFTRFKIPFEQKLQFGASVSSVVEENSDAGGYYWIGTYAGLVKFNSESKEFTRYRHQENSAFSLINDQINAMIKDRSGVIWIATENGISYFSGKEVRFNNVISTTLPLNKFKEMGAANVTSIIEDDKSGLIVGSTEGLFFLDNKHNIISFPDINTWTLCKSKNSKIWIGTYGQGLKEFNTLNKTIKQVEIETDFILPSFYRYIKSICQDKKGYLWIGFWGSGLVRYNPDKNEFRAWINKPGDSLSLSYNDVWSIIEDKFGNIWIGTNGGGINLVDQQAGLSDKTTERFIRLSTSSIKNKLSSNTIYTLLESKNPRVNKNPSSTVIWAGTANGLNKITFTDAELLNKNKTLNVSVRVYTTENGLPDNSVKSIVEDDNGNLWIATSNGLSEFNPVEEEFVNFSTADGLNSNNFNSGAGFKAKNGTIFLGSSKGLNVFNPSTIIRSDYAPPVFITDFQLFNKSVAVGDDSPLKENIIYTDQILLSHDQNICSFQFTALDFNSPKSIKYAYKMEGFDKDWIQAGSRRYAAYTNLPPGNYTFKVKATNSDGVWNEKFTSVNVIINQPWWKTGWAYLLYLMIVVLGLFAIRRFELNRTKLRNELKMREFEAQKMKEIENVKSRFFANLSHEFRTPLMLIKGPIEQLKNGKVNGSTSDYYDLIYRNTEKLHHLIDQLLELTQLEAEAIPVKAKKENIVTILRGLFYSFKSIADQKNISLDFFTYDTSINAWIDRDKLEKIINNLLSNAIKFTPDGGLISLNILNSKIGDDEFAEVKISDTGIGIAPEKLDRIFDRFYQIDDSFGRNYGGSGIGLSLVKELVDLHRWNIIVESEKGKGTTFTLKIPLRDNYLSPNQIIENDKNEIEVLDKIISETIIADKVNESILWDSELNKSVPSILIVEDSSDVREYIYSLLQNDYNIFQADSAEAGITKAGDLMPDLIISDIMMPGTDGLEFCRQIKSNLQTSHIPVILLTAKVSKQNKIEGLETGADDYVTKPFDFAELSARIKNLIEQRKKLKEKFSKEVKIEPDAVTVNALDKEFLEKALAVAEKNIFNLNFDLESFAKEMFLSRSQLHRKMIAITGQAPGEFLRVFKLKKAAQLLLEKKLSVTQIALEVGFRSPSHFTKAFQQYFNCLPSEFTVKNTSS